MQGLKTGSEPLQDLRRSGAVGWVVCDRHQRHRVLQEADVAASQLQQPNGGGNPGGG